MKIQDKLNVSGRTARRLLEEYRTVFQTESLGERIFELGCGGDPAVSYDRHMRRTLLRQRIAEILKPRELTLVRSYLGLCHPDQKRHVLSGTGRSSELQRTQRRGKGLQKMPSTN